MTRIEQWTHVSFQSEIVKQARRLGWKPQYFWHNIHSPKGWLDLVLARPESSRLIFAELKMPKDYVSKEQQEWIDVWKQYKWVEVYVWRPDDWDEILKILK